MPAKDEKLHGPGGFLGEPLEICQRWTAKMGAVAPRKDVDFGQPAFTGPNDATPPNLDHHARHRQCIGPYLVTTTVVLVSKQLDATTVVLF